MGGKSSSPQVVQVPQQATTTHQLSPEQQELLNLAMPGLRNFATHTPERYSGGTVAPFTAPQVAGQNQVLGAASGSMQDLANTGASANQFLMGDIWNPASNPHLQGAIDATIRPITEQYMQTVRPAIRDNFAAAGQQFGGSRRNIAEGIAATGYMRNVGDATSKLVQDQYANNLNAMVRALALNPQTMQSQTMPGLATSGVGDVQQAQQQAELNSQIQGFNYDQLAPFLQSRELISMLTGIPGGSTYMQGMQGMVMPQQPSRFQTGVGGAMAGASLGSVVPGIGTGIGAGLGGLLGFLS